MSRTRTRTQKASFNIVTAAIAEAVSLVSTMVLPRLILIHYGSAYNGIASSASQFLSLISVLTLGVTAVTRVALYKTLASDDIKGTSKILRATEIYMRRVGWVLFVYIFGLAIIYPLVVKTDFSYLDVALLILITGASSFAEYFFGITYRTLLLADQCVYISNIFQTLAVALSLTVSVILINLGCSFQIVKLGSAVVFIIRLIAQNIYVSKHYGIEKGCEPDFSALKQRSDAMAHALANIVHDNTDIVILTLFTDVKTVSVYTVYNLVMAALKKLQLIFNTGTEPIFGNMWANNEKDKLRRTLDFYEFSVAMFGSIVYSTTIIMLLSFVSLYTKGVTDVNYIRPVYGIVISAAYAVQCVRVPYLCVVGGVGHYKQTKNAAILEAVTNLVLSTVLVNSIGMVGVAIGTLAANLIRTIQYAVYIDNHVIPRGKGAFIKKIGWQFFNIVIIVLPMYRIVNVYHFKNWFNWACGSLIVVIICTAIVVLSALIFLKKEFFEACHIYLRIIKRSIGVQR